MYTSVNDIPILDVAQNILYYNPPIEYIYTNINSLPHQRVLRYEIKKDFLGTEKKLKEFRQFRWDEALNQWISGLENIERVIYNLLEVSTSDLVVFHEGEKCAELCKAKLGLVSSCICGGISGWKPYYAQYFKDKDVIIIPDYHDEGLRFGNKVAKEIYGTAKSIKIITVTEQHKGDIEQFIDEGGTAEKLFQLGKDIPEWKLQEKVEILAAPKASEWDDPENILNNIKLKPVLKLDPYSLPNGLDRYVMDEPEYRKTVLTEVLFLL